MQMKRKGNKSHKKYLFLGGKIEIREIDCTLMVNIIYLFGYLLIILKQNKAKSSLVEYLKMSTIPLNADGRSNRSSKILFL